MHDTPYEQQRARALCLTGIVVVSLCAGALIGRYSAVVFPILSVAGVPAESRPQPVRHAAGRSVGSLAEHLNPKSPEGAAAGEDRPNNARQITTVHETGGTHQTADGPKKADSTQKLSAAAENVEKSGTTTEQPGESKISGATILNPEANQRARDARKMPDSMSRSDNAETQPKLSGDASPANSECARRYASFREGDGTYQPYGSGQRKTCPLLR